MSPLGPGLFVFHSTGRAKLDSDSGIFRSARCRAIKPSALNFHCICRDSIFLYFRPTIGRRDYLAHRYVAYSPYRLIISGV